MNRIFNVISWVGIALVVAALGVFYGMPGQEQYARYLAWAGLACILVYVLSQYREILAFFGTRSGRYGTAAASSLLIVLGILVAVNYIGKKQSRRWDLTSNAQYSLSDQSRTVVQKLDAPLKVRVFVQETQFQTYRDRFREYEYNSKQITTEYIDPDKKPTVAQQANVQQLGTIIFDYKGRSERTNANTEQDITNTIIKVVSGEVRKIYFTQGHGEHDPTSAERDGYQGVNSALLTENYGVEKLVLAQTSKVPDDATAVVVAGAKTDFFAPEIDALKAYLEKNGKLLLMVDPPSKADAAPLTNLTALAHEWGIDLTNTMVVDASGMGRQIGAGPESVIAAGYPKHPITDRLNLVTLFPISRGLSIVSGGVNGHTASPVVESGAQSWAEADIKGLMSGGETTLDETKGDKPGPITVAAAVNFSKDAAAVPPGADAPPKPETRVVVFGDSDFASNSAIGFSGNKDMFMNAVGWLSQQENLISIRPKDAADRRFRMPLPLPQSVLAYGSWLLMPLLIFGLGIYTWSRRR